MTGRDYRVALIGAGFMGAVHSQAWASVAYIQDQVTLGGGIVDVEVDLLLVDR